MKLLKYAIYESTKEDMKLTESLFCKLLKNKISDEIIKGILIKKSKTANIKYINEINSEYKDKEKAYNELVNEYRARAKWNIIKKYLKASKIKTKFNSILDFGGNRGDVPAYFRKILKLSKEQAISVDVLEWSGLKWKPRKDITFIESKYLDTIKDSSMDIILCSHTLHHISNKNLKKILPQLINKLSPNGIFLLYEHDCISRLTRNILDIEHLIYDVVINKNLTYDEFIKEHYANYKSKSEWIELLEEYDLTNVFEFSKERIDRSFYMLFRKL